jgi:type VI secretion system protein ImpM
MRPRRVRETGFYGKVRTHGDFVGQGLAPEFVARWDRWLQAGMLKTRERFGDAWLDSYLAMPLWHFSMRPGVAGGCGYAGVMMPGIDAVGRYFPFAIARVMTDADEPPRDDGAPGAAWHEAAARLALSSLKTGFSLTAFEAALAVLPTQEAHAATASLPSADDADSVWWHRTAAGERGALVRHRHDGPLDTALFLRLLDSHAAY